MLATARQIVGLIFRVKRLDNTHYVKIDSFIRLVGIHSAETILESNMDDKRNLIVIAETFLFSKIGKPKTNLQRVGHLPIRYSKKTLLLMYEHEQKILDVRCVSSLKGKERV